MSLFDTIQKKSASAENNHYQPALQMQDDVPRLIANDAGIIVFANDAFKTLSEYSQDFENTYIHDLMIFANPEQDLDDGKHKVMLTDNQRELSLQFSWIDTKDGERFLVASAEEMTAREKLLDYVAEKIKHKYNKFADHTPFIDLSFDACSITDNDGSFITINANFTDLFGYKIENLSDKTLIDMIHPSDKGEFLGIFQSLRLSEAEEQSISLETCCIDSQGQQLWVEWNHKSVHGRIYSTCRNITPLKTYKESLERQQKKLLEAEAIGHIGQWRWPVGSDKIEFSDQLFKIFGVTSDSFRPTLDSVTNMIHRQDSDRMMQVFQRAIIEQNDYEMDFRLHRPDGEIRFIRCEGRCEADAEDDVIALYGIMQDVTEPTKREIDLREAKENAERAYAAKSQFLANMSHELRTPLNAIIGFSEMIERQLLGPIGTEKYLEYIGGIRQSGEHLLDLISDILDMSKIEAGKYELHLEKFNIAKVIRMAVHMMEGRALDAEIKINIDISNEELNIVADRRAVMQMILNLLSNAVKFSKHGKTINVQMKERDEHLSISVEDEGIGIPANKLASITLPFEQAESDYTREYEGSGLGLAITKDLTEIHGGNLHIESTIDVGTKVTIKLPYEAKKTQPIPCSPLF